MRPLERLTHRAHGWPGSVFEQIELIGPLTDPSWVTIPFLPDFAEWAAYEAARQNTLPKLSRNTPAPRYRAVTANAVGA
jgi:hypothetical protein